MLLAHVYHVSLPHWPDIDFIIRRQTAEHLFVGGLPEDREEAWKKLLLACGKSPMILRQSDPNVRGKYIRGKREKTRLLEDPSIFTKYFKDRFYVKGSDWDRDSSTVKLFREITQVNALRELAKRYMLPRSAVAAQTAAWTKEIEPMQKKGWKTHQKLAWLERWSLADSVDLNFDWLAFHEVCATIWDKSYKILMNEPDFHVQFLPNDPDRHEAIAWQILYDASVGRSIGIERISAVMGYMVLQANSTPGVRYHRWRGDAGLCSAIQQSTTRGLAYPLSFLCEDPMFVSECYQHWTPALTGERQVAQSLLPAAAKAYMNGQLNNFAN
jgi:hypothetical protein